MLTPITCRLKTRGRINHLVWIKLDPTQSVTDI